MWVDAGLRNGTSERPMRDLTPLQIKRLPPGVHRVARGLYARVTPVGSRMWVHRYKNRCAHEMGLGSVDLVTLEEAKDAVTDARRLLRQGIDPIEHRRSAKPVAQHTFQRVAELFIDAHHVEWVPKHTKNWRASLLNYVYPKLGGMPISTITTGDVLKTLKPIWHMTSASVLRRRIERVWLYGKSLGWTVGDCPAAWVGCLEPLLADPNKRRAIHRPALPWQQMPEFMLELAAASDIWAQALRATILTNARTGMVLKATWTEFDRARAVWTIPASHIKSGKEYKLPLSKPIIALLESVTQTADRVFPIGHDLMNRRLAQFSRVDAKGQPVSVHGFRSTFRDWCEEQTQYSRTVVEIAMQHSVGTEVEQSYRRGDLFAQRMSLMAHWAEFCGG